MVNTIYETDNAVLKTQAEIQIFNVLRDTTFIVCNTPFHLSALRYKKYLIFYRSSIFEYKLIIYHVGNTDKSNEIKEIYNKCTKFCFRTK